MHPAHDTITGQHRRSMATPKRPGLAVHDDLALTFRAPVPEPITPTSGIMLLTPVKRGAEALEMPLTFYRWPLAHHKHLKSTNMLERINEELKRRTYVIRIFPNAESCLRLVRALAVEIHENWIEQNRYLNMELLKEHRKEVLRMSPDKEAA